MYIIHGIAKYLYNIAYKGNPTKPNPLCLGNGRF